MSIYRQAAEVDKHPAYDRSRFRIGEKVRLLRPYPPWNPRESYPLNATFQVISFWGMPDWCWIRQTGKHRCLACLLAFIKCCGSCAELVPPNYMERICEDN